MWKWAQLIDIEAGTNGIFRAFLNVFPGKDLFSLKFDHVVPIDNNYTLVQAIPFNCTNNDPVRRRVYASPGLNE